MTWPAVALALSVGCAAAPPAASPAGAPPPPAPLDEELDLALAVARGGGASPTPELDALTEALVAITPELGLSELLGSDGALPQSRLRPGDTIRVSVFGRDEFSDEHTISQDGAIRIPLVGSVAAEGRTEGELSDAIRRELERSYLQRAVVTVRALARGRRDVLLTGRVAKPGAFSLPAERPLGLHGLLTLAGGLEADADGSRLALVRGERCYHVAYAQLLAAHVQGRRAWLQPGDQVVVPRLPDAFVHGAVQSPGRQPLRPGSTVASLLMLAGGVTDDADARAIRIITGPGQAAPAAFDAPLAPGAVVYVPRLQRVYVTGAVARVGPLSLPRAGLTVLQALAEAGWFTDVADIDGTTILRSNGAEDAPETIRVPISRLLAGERAAAQFRLEPGDLITVPERVW